jgi:hypothetical protein
VNAAEISKSGLSGDDSSLSISGKTLLYTSEIPQIFGRYVRITTVPILPDLEYSTDVRLR